MTGAESMATACVSTARSKCAWRSPTLTSGEGGRNAYGQRGNRTSAALSDKCRPTCGSGNADGGGGKERERSTTDSQTSATLSDTVPLNMGMWDGKEPTRRGGGDGKGKGRRRSLPKRGHEDPRRRTNETARAGDIYEWRQGLRDQEESHHWALAYKVQCGCVGASGLPRAASS